MDNLDQSSCFGPEFDIDVINIAYLTVYHNDKHRTFRVRKVKENEPMPKNAQILSLLVGSDNTSSYKQFAFINKYGAFVFKKLREDKCWQAYADLVFDLITKGVNSKYYDLGYRMIKSEHCFRCGRLLTTPESIESGIGPICCQL